MSNDPVMMVIVRAVIDPAFKRHLNLLLTKLVGVRIYDSAQHNIDITVLILIR